MPVPQITAVRLGGSPALPLLVLGPSLGTSARALWSGAAAHLSDAFEVVAWDLPGHGSNPIVARPFTMAELAAGVLAMVDDMVAERGELDTSFAYAGDSVGGAVGLHLLLDSPARVDAAVLLCTGARIGEATTWHERAASVRASGTSAVVEGSAARWFAPGFVDREPTTGSALLTSLQDTDPEGYAQVCEALAGHDVRSRLDRIRTPVLAVAGSDDVPTPTATLREIADGVRDGRLVTLEGVAHLAPAEAPAEVARLVRAHVLGEAPLGTLPTAPALDPRSRSLVIVTALVAGGHLDDLASHLRSARAHGLTTDELTDVLEIAMHCGVPGADGAMRAAEDVFAEIDRAEPA